MANFTAMKQRKLHVEDSVAEFGNSFGHIALWTMSFFLLSVSRHSPLLQNQVHKFHIWPGRIVVISGVFHGLVHMYRWKFKVGVSLLEMILPPLACWQANHKLSDQHECLDIMTGCTCYDKFRNLAGICAATGMLVIGLTSLYKVRRRWYRFFYLMHASMAPITMLILCLHFTRSLIYMAPSLLYYVAVSFPFFTQEIKKWKRKLRILSCQQVSHECVSFTFEASEEAMNQYKPGQHVLLRAPTLSLLSHPFTVNRIFGENHQFRITFRETGVFTKSLAALLLEKDGPTPFIQLDGFHGSTHRLEEVSNHDIVVMIAGGIGIVAYLSLLENVVANATMRPTKIQLHWACRDASLVRFIQCQYLNRILIRASELDQALQITIHMTLDSQQDDEANMVDSNESFPHEGADGESFSPYSFQSRGFGYFGAILTYTLNICFGIVISWYACANALHEEDPAATVWCYVCVFGIGIYVCWMATKMDTRHFAVFTIVIWTGLWCIWYFYLTKQEENARILSRLWSPISIVVVGAMAATASACRSVASNAIYYKPVIQSCKDTEIELGHVAREDEGEYCGSTEGRRIAASSGAEIVTERVWPPLHSKLIGISESK